MEYALIENGIVTNVIWLHPNNANEFPNAVFIGDYPVAIGDTYEDGIFYREGEKVLTYAEETTKYYQEQLASQEKQLQTLSDFAVAMAHQEQAN